MGRISRANILKTIYYLKRNGITKTWYAVRERLDERKRPPYVWTPPAEEETERQRGIREREGWSVTFSIVVPAYRTPPVYLREMLKSVCRQTYPCLELILADATEDDSVESVAGEVKDPRIRYVRLKENAGIAENTNQALTYAKGDYVALLDHDDILTEDALYEVAARIEAGKRRGTAPEVLYSDEDKCNGAGTEYYEPNLKEDFNLDLLLSNNYVCHLLVMKGELIRRLKFRPEYEGAQDYDLILRAAAELMRREEAVVHIPRVLYHWRCHSASTAENPRSKLHAYEAGRRAVQDFADRKGWKARAVNTDHVGFYRLKYEGDIFAQRQDIGAVGGRLIRRGRVAGGRLKADGTLFYENLPARYSGYLHRAALPQDADAVDLRNIRVREECRELFEQVTGIAYRTVPGSDLFDASALPEDFDIHKMSLKLGEALRKEGRRILYLPECTGKLRG